MVTLENIKVWIIGILILIIVLMKQCTKCPEISTQVSYRTETYIDTILFNDTIVTYLEVSVLKPISENIDPIDSSIIREYNNPFEDSLLVGNFYVKVDGTLINHSISYTPKFPKYIHTIDSVFITTTNTINENPKMNFMVGGTVNIGTTSSVTPIIGLQLKDKTLVQLGYNPFNKTVLFGAMFRIGFNKK